MKILASRRACDSAYNRVPAPLKKKKSARAKQYCQRPTRAVCFCPGCKGSNQQKEGICTAVNRGAVTEQGRQGHSRAARAAAAAAKAHAPARAQPGPCCRKHQSSLKNGGDVQGRAAGRQAACQEAPRPHAERVEVGRAN